MEVVRRRIPIVVLTAHASRQDVAEARALGCRAYETKPVDLPQFVERIGQAIEAGRCRRRRASRP